MLNFENNDTLIYVFYVWLACMEIPIRAKNSQRSIVNLAGVFTVLRFVLEHINC